MKLRKDSTSYTEINYVQKTILKYEPDLLIVYDGWDDLTKSEKYYESSGRQDLVSNLIDMLTKNPYYKTVNILLKNYNNWRISNVDSVKPINSEDFDERVNLWQKNWTKICEQGNKEDFDVIITLQPLLGTDLNN